MRVMMMTLIRCQRQSMLLNKPKQGFGMRSWRYSAIINNGVVEQFFEEPGFNNESDDDDPYTVSAPEHVIKQL